MSVRDPRYDILFEPVKIGPVTARNRFFQVPHCNGMGYRDASAVAAMRGMKAEGGWAVVSTEMCEIHPTADVTPYIELRLWDDRDVPMHRQIAQAIHNHGSLAAVELCHTGHVASNLWSREVALGVTAMPISSSTHEPYQARAMDLSDIRNIRLSHRAAALRAQKAGYDLIYVYAGHGLSIFQHFLSRLTNHRSDEYGGSLQNRLRLLREVVEDTKEAVGDSCAVPLRIAMSEGAGPAGLEPAEVEDMIGLMAELPDLWDLSLSDWSRDSQSARFSEEGFQEPFIKGVKRLTSKPVVGVGRYTSPDTMVRVIRQGVMDMIGAARPSIADPFLPNKIEEGRSDDIRECIGCNMCITGDFAHAPSRCTQNPAMGEEFRRGWHPEKIRIARGAQHLAIIGTGPAGLEAARALGQRGVKITLADKAPEAGGRVTLESRLPGLNTWGRVRDWRLGQINKMPNVSLYLESEMTAELIKELEVDETVIATGSHWLRDGRGRASLTPLAIGPGLDLLSPDDLMSGVRAKSPHVLLYDDDHNYMGGVLAELLIKQGCKVDFLTPSSLVSFHTRHSLEQAMIQKRLIELGCAIITSHKLVAAEQGRATLSCTFTGTTRDINCSSLVLVTARQSDDQLYRDMISAGLTASIIGDALAPATIAAAVYAGRKFAENYGEPPEDFLQRRLRREVTELKPDQPF